MCVHKRTVRGFNIIAASRCLLLLLLTGSLHIALAAKQPVYRFGVVPQFEIRRIHDTWHPILKAIEKQTGIRLELKGLQSITEFEKQLEKGEFDFAYMNPYHLIMANNAQGYRPILRDHSGQLQGILVVAKDSNITELRQLQNKTVAFPSPNALGASLLMRAELHDEFNLTIQPLYVKSHDSVYLNVALKQTPAGGGVEKTLEAQSAQVRSQLRVLYRTRKVSAHPIAVHPRVAEEITQKLIAAFQQLEKTQTGKALLHKIPIHDIGPATLSDYESLNAMRLDRFYEAAQ